MKMPRLSLALVGSMVVAASLVLSACAAPKIKTRSQTDPNVNLSSYHTYGFVAGAGNEPIWLLHADHHLLQDRHHARDECARLHVYSEDSPQLLINFNTNAHEQVDIRSTPSMSYGYGYYGYRGGMYAAGPIGGTDVETVRYKQGTANIDVVDAAKKQLVWEGVAEGKITDEMMKNPQATIDGVITDMFAEYPVKAPVQ